MGVLCVYEVCIEWGLVVGGYGFCGVGGEIYEVNMFVLLCVVLVFVLLKPTYSVCDVDCSVGYCSEYETILFGCVTVSDP